MDNNFSQRTYTLASAYNTCRQLLCCADRKARSQFPRHKTFNNTTQCRSKAIIVLVKIKRVYIDNDETLEGILQRPRVYSNGTNLSYSYIVLTLKVKVAHTRPYSITECRVPELIPVLCSQPASDMSHKPGVRLPLLSARQLPPQPLRGLLPILLLGEPRHNGCEQFAQDC